MGIELIREMLDRVDTADTDDLKRRAAQGALIIAVDRLVDLVASLQGEIENLRYAMEHHDTSRR